MKTTEAWILRRGPQGTPGLRGELELSEVKFEDPGPGEALVEPIYGCWEAAMYHGLDRQPVDVCDLRGDDYVVLGHAGVARVLETGSEVTTCSPGDVCLVFPSAKQDEHGYQTSSIGWDDTDAVGLLAKQAKLPGCTLIPLPENTRHPLTRWAGFPTRYPTAWSNWSVALGCWRTQVDGARKAHPDVWAWGGGTAFAEVTLAARSGARAAMLASGGERLAEIAAGGVVPIDRDEFGELAFDPARYEADGEFRKAYRAAEKKLVAKVREMTDGAGADIFVENIGLPVHRATLKALAREAVLTSVGWRHGMNLEVVRAIECMSRHIHVHTHCARYDEAVAAAEFAEQNDWLPPSGPPVYRWENVPDLAEDYRMGRISSYFPLFEVNPEATAEDGAA